MPGKAPTACGGAAASRPLRVPPSGAGLLTRKKTRRMALKGEVAIEPAARPRPIMNHRSCGLNGRFPCSGTQRSEPVL